MAHYRLPLVHLMNDRHCAQHVGTFCSRIFSLSVFMAQKTWNSRAQLAKSHGVNLFCLVMSFDSIDYVIFACVGIGEDVGSAGRAVYGRWCGLLSLPTSPGSRRRCRGGLLCRADLPIIQRTFLVSTGPSRHLCDLPRRWTNHG